MKLKEKSGAEVATSNTAIKDNQQANCSKISKKTKEGKVAIALMARSYNRFEATRELHDWCLHTTVSTLQKKGIEVARVFETIPGYQGNPVRVCRYWIAPSEHQKVKQMLEAA